nr:MBL fold metallo-hydrolase [Micromonospora sp. DSM 115978]
MHPSALDAVVISHFHTDHCYDLLPIGKTLLSGRLHDPLHFPTLPATADTPERPSAQHWPPLPLYVPAGGRTTLDALAAVFPVPTAPALDKAFEIAFDVREYAPGTVFTVGDCTVSLHPQQHTLPNCGIRVETTEGTFAYTGDAQYTGALVDLARDVDLLLAEATLELPDDCFHGHLSATEAGYVARDAGVGQLVLTHFVTDDQPWLAARKAEAERCYTGPVHLAAPGRRFEVR